MRKRARTIILLCAAVLVAASVPALADSPRRIAREWTPRPATYGVAVGKDVSITMSDGIVLTADVLRPAGPDGKPAPGRFPVVLSQTPYNKNIPELNFRSDYLVRRGYVQVIVDVRGTGGSEGTWDAWGTREQRDGYELVQWAARQPWSDGKVALHGGSYGGINQLLTAAQQPAALEAIFPIVPMGDAYRDILGSGGQFNGSFLPAWLALVTGAGALPPSYAPADPLRAGTTVGSHAAGALSFQVPSALSLVTGGKLAYDGPFFRTRSPLEVVDQVQVPTFLVGGLFDLFQRGTPLLYQRLAANGVPSRLLYGPWTHIEAAMGNGLPADGVPTLDELELRWFDHYVRGMPDPTLERDIAPVTYYELGADEFRRAASWPPAGVRFEAFHLTGSASPGRPGTLRAKPGEGSDPDFVPWVPVAGLCSRSITQWTAGLAKVPVCETDNRLNDLTGVAYDLPVTEPMRLAGPIAAHLVVSTPAKDGQLTVRVEDVAPDGTATQLTAGWQVLSLRALDESRSVKRDGHIVRPWHPYTKESVLDVPRGEPVEVWVEIFPTAAVIEPGHRLRISIQTADFPHKVAPVPQLVDSLGPGMKLWHDPEHRSYVVLPVRSTR